MAVDPRERGDVVAPVPLPPPAARFDRLLVLVFRTLVVGLTYVAVAAMVVNVFMLKWGFLDDMPEKNYHALTTHTASRPYAYRVLSPAIVRAVDDWLPGRLKARIIAKGEEPADARPFPRAVAERFHFSNLDVSGQYVGYFYMFGCLVLLQIALRFLLLQVPDASPFACDFAPVVGLTLLPLTFTCGGYMYDFAELVFVTLSFYLLLRQKWLAYYTVFVFACLNKETDVFVVLYFVGLYAGRFSRQRFVKHLAIHGVAGALGVIAPHLLLAGNRGVAAENHWFAHLRYLLSLKPYFEMQDVYAPLIPVPRPLNIAVLFLVGFAVLHGWREKPIGWRRAFLLPLSVLVPLFVVLGWYDEVRALYVVFPPLALLTYDTLVRVYTGPLSLCDRRPSS